MAGWRLEDNSCRRSRGEWARASVLANNRRMGGIVAGAIQAAQKRRFRSRKISRAEAQVHLGAFVARLKSCPDTRRDRELIRSHPSPSHPTDEDLSAGTPGSPPQGQGPVRGGQGLGYSRRPPTGAKDSGGRDDASALAWGAKSGPQGLNRLRKKAYSRRKSVKSMPQGLKATFISCHLYRG